MPATPRVTFVVLILLLIHARSSSAQAPRIERRFDTPFELAGGQTREVPTTHLLAGGLAGGVVGFFAFGFLGAVIADRYFSEGDEFAALGGFMIGGLVGESVGLPVGVHLTNRRQGDFATSLLASVGIAAVGVGLTAAMEDMAIVFLPAIPIAQLIATINIERNTAN
jgi:hypothetical protein